MADIVPPSANPIVVPSDQKPTLLNGGALNGAIAGAVMGGAHAGLGAAAGGVIGGMLGKEALENNYTYGRTVRPPMPEGWQVTIGALLFGTVLLALSAAGGVAGAPLAVLAITGAVAGGVTGIFHHHAMQRDYENAQRYYVRHGGNYQGREREAQLTQAEALLLQQRLAAAQGRNFTDQVADASVSQAMQR